VNKCDDIVYKQYIILMDHGVNLTVKKNDLVGGPPRSTEVITTIYKHP